MKMRMSTGILFMISILFACGGGGGGGTGTTNSAALVSIAVAPSTPSIPVGATQQLTATGTYSDNHTQDLTRSATWSSSDAALASIDIAGLATSHAAGSAVITATSGGISGNTTLVVTGAAPSAPARVAASAGNSTVTISWDSVAGATSYNIYWSTTPVVTKTTGTKISNAASPYTFAAFNGITCYVVVTAVNPSGESVESQPVSAIPSVTSQSPFVSVTPSSLNFGNSVTTASLSMNNTGGDIVLPWSIVSNQSWLSASPLGGMYISAGTTSFTATVDRSRLARGSYSGTLNITWNGGNQVVPVTMSAPNNAPIIASSQASACLVNTACPYSVTATDADGDALTYSLTAAPSGMQINSATGVITWTPNSGGIYNAAVSVEDGHGGVAARNLYFSAVVTINAGGAVPSDTTWTLSGSPYLLNGNVLVQSGVTLTIEPGVVVEFGGGKSLQVNGTLIARGTGTNNIIFTSSKTNPAAGDWGNILFSDTSTDASFDAAANYIGGSILEHITIEYGGGIQTAFNPGMVLLYRACPFINYATVKNSASSGISGIDLMHYIQIRNSIISNNQSGIYLSDYSHDQAATITKCIIEGNNGYGISSLMSQNVISENIISSNGGCGVFGDDWGLSYISHNIVSDNKSSGLCTGKAIIGYNSIVNNKALDAPAFNPYVWDYHDIEYNTITGNSAIGQSPTSSVKVGTYMRFKFNNIFSNSSTYELVNINSAGTQDVDGTNNWWGTATESEIQAKIFDWFDDSAWGVVTCNPWSGATVTAAPISPPAGLAAAAGAGQITLTWQANPESDTAGYNVYWSMTSGFPYAHSVDVGNVTTYTIGSLPAGTYYVTVTAYDADAASVADDPNTIINEKQTSGHESWYSAEQVVIITTSPFAPKMSTMKRPDSEGGAKSGCFIATAAYGSFLDPHVQALRDFRDAYLLTNPFGRMLVAFYCKHSPAIAGIISRHDVLRTATRWALTPVVFVIKYPVMFPVLLVLIFWPYLRKYST